MSAGVREEATEAADGGVPRLRVESRHRSGAHVLSLVGEAGVWDTAPLESALTRLAAGRPRDVVIDLDRCTALSTQAVATIIEFYRSVRAHGGRVRLAALRPVVQDTFHTLRVEPLFTIHATLAGALARRV